MLLQITVPVPSVAMCMLRWEKTSDVGFPAPRDSGGWWWCPKNRLQGCAAAKAAAICMHGNAQGCQ